MRTSHDTNRATTRVRGVILTLLLGLMGSGAAAAQDGVELQDVRWLPYLGCWVETGLGPMTCVVPDGSGVAFLTVSDGEVVDRYTLTAGVADQPIEVAGCRGTMSLRFAEGSSRAYTEESLTCDEGARQTTRGLMTFAGPDRWVQILALEGPGESAAWTRRYRPAAPERVEAAGLADRLPSGRAVQAVEGARVAAAGRITVDDIIEAHARTETEVVRAWVAEQGEPVRLDADRLVRLADAGVPAAVIDVAVAVSFPEHFTVSAEATEERAPDRGVASARYGVCSAWSPFAYSDPYCFGYDRYRYGFDRYGYDRYGYGPNPVIVVVRPTERQRPSGTMVRGRGYTSPTATDRPARPRSSVTRPSADRGSAVRSSGSKGKARPRGG